MTFDRAAQYTGVAPAFGRLHLQFANQFFVFAALGAVGTSGHYLTFVLLVELAHIVPVVASACGFGVGAVINYALHYKFTFRSRVKHQNGLTRFMIVGTMGALINTSVMWLGTEAVQISYIVTQLIATGMVLIFNFTVNRIWTFREQG